mmetsp:Transcript_49151/g.36204  ORF Transcript_49151/g.36204 Transcript_49151/m.36204 type:complete len:106 (+) Transcript_49151:1059-1376(+)
MKLPINAKLQDEITTLASVAVDRSAWSSLLDPTSIFKLFYSLRIVMFKGTDQSALQWRAAFSQLGGFNHLLKTFLDLNLAKIETNLTIKCIELLINMLYDFSIQD